MLDADNNFPGQLSITKILQFDCYTHLTAILQERLLPLCGCKPVSAMQGRPVTQAFKSISTISVENGMATKGTPGHPSWAIVRMINVKSAIAC
jgi:hypothetical protein